jgi:hypothetical protein
MTNVFAESSESSRRIGFNVVNLNSLDLFFVSVRLPPPLLWLRVLQGSVVSNTQVQEEFNQKQGDTHYKWEWVSTLLVYKIYIVY